jgi:hypothetical protein
LLACFGRDDLVVTREWLYCGDRVGPFGNFLSRRKCPRVPTRAIQQIIVFVYSGQATPAGEDRSGAENGAQASDSSTPLGSFLAGKIEEKIRDLVNGSMAGGNGELAIVEKPGAEPTPYFTGFPTRVLLDLAEQLHRHVARGQPSLPPVAVLDKPAAAVRAEWEAMAREARAALEGPMPVMWWQRRLWLQAALLLNSLAGLVALLRLVWRDGIDARWKFAGLACVLVEVFVVYFEVAARAGQPRARANRPSGG